jgi:hypothetical protein
MIKAAFVLIGQAEISSFIVPSLFLETADRALAVVATINLRGPVELFSGCDRRRTFRHLPRLERSRHCILLSCCYGSGTRPSATPGRTAWTCAPLFFRVSCVGNKWSVLVKDLQTAKYMSEYQKFHTDCRNANQGRSRRARNQSAEAAAGHRDYLLPCLEIFETVFLLSDDHDKRCCPNQSCLIAN